MFVSDSSPSSSSPSPSEDESLESDELSAELLLLLLTESAGEAGRCRGGGPCSSARFKSSADTAILTAI
jgi:hypothetical protein